MSGKGAPEGNQYAVKSSGAGKTISLYLTSEDFELLRFVLARNGHDTSDTSCIELAKKAGKMGINLLLKDEYYRKARNGRRK